MQIGTRLRELRLRQGLSQRELARRSGVTNATISMIERDQISPSIGSLKRILDALDITLGRFFAPEEEVQTRVFYGKDELVEIADGRITFLQVGRSLEERALQLMHETYRPGADTGEEMLRHASEEAGWVIRGRIEITVGDQTRVLGPGEAYYFDSRLPHRFRNTGRENCIIISACTPPSF